MRRLQTNRDDGFTLIELVIASLIIGVITLPLGNLVIEYFRSTAQTQGRLHESHDAQITAAFFSQDVASIGIRDQTTQNLTQSLWTPGAGAPLACNAGITPFLALAWDQFDSAGVRTAVVVEYGTRSQLVGQVTQLQLVRLHCTGSASPDGTSVVAHNLTGTPTVTCTGNGASSCNDGTNVPSLVTMSLSIRDVDDNSPTPYTISVSGQRRQT